MANRLAACARACLGILLGGALWLGPQHVLAQAPSTAGAPCPVPLDQLGGRPGVVNPGVDVCVDRGDGAVYAEGDPITICVTVSVPTIMIYPPPPPPMVRVTNSTNGGPAHTLLAEQFNGAHRCVTSAIAPPLGDDLFSAQVIGQNGTAIAQDEVRIVSVPR
jgi:hypothetical protein